MTATTPPSLDDTKCPLPSSPPLAPPSQPDAPLGEPGARPGEPDARPWLPPPLRGMRAAFVFFTRIPVSGFPYRSADFRWAGAHAPFVGLVLGGVLGALDVLLLPVGALAAAILVLGASLLFTGAFHEDGLADTSDALGGGYDVAKVLAILKDSRIGSFGGAALVISIIGRAALLASLGRDALYALPLAFCGARVGPIWLMATMRYVTSDETSRSRQLTQGGPVQAVVATAWLVAAIIACIAANLISWPRALALATALLVVTILTGWRYKSRVGGITGDFLGATEQLGELVALGALAWKAAT